MVATLYTVPDLANIHCQEVDGVKVLQLETAAGAAIKVSNFNSVSLNTQLHPFLSLDIFVTLFLFFRDVLFLSRITNYHFIQPVFRPGNWC